MGAERTFLPVIALAGGTVVLYQVADLMTLGTDLTTPTGRLGLVAILWTHGPALVAGDVFLVGAAALSRWRRVLAGLAILHLLVGLTAMAEASFFLSDAGRVAGNIAEGELTSFRITVVRILVGLAVVGVGSAVAGVSLFRLEGSEGTPV